MLAHSVPPSPRAPRLCPEMSCCEGEGVAWVVTLCLPRAESHGPGRPGWLVCPPKSLLQKGLCALGAPQQGQRGRGGGGSERVFPKPALLVEAVSFRLPRSSSSSVSSAEGCARGVSPSWWLVSSWVWVWVWVCSQLPAGPGRASPRWAGAECRGLPAGQASTGRARGTTPRSTRGSRSAARRSGRCSACCWWRSPAACSPCCCTRRSVGKQGRAGGQAGGAELAPASSFPAVTAPASELSGHAARRPVGLSLTPPCSQDMAHCTCPHMS